MQSINNQYQRMIKVILFLIAFTSNGAFALMSQTASKDPINYTEAPTPTPNPRPSFEAQLTTDSTQTKCLLEVENPTKKRLVVRIYHHFYGELFRYETKDATYKNCFNLQGVEDGRYTIEVAAGKEKIRKQLSINTITQVNRKMAIN